MITDEHIHESNLIEGFDDPEADYCLLDSWKYLERYLHQGLTKDLICEALFKLTFHQKELNSIDRNRYREVNVTVGGRLCPAPYIVPELMHNWLLDMNEQWKTIEPKEMHIRFEKIHPFIDGNGRVGRLLMWWHEEKLGREPTLILNSEKQGYYKWFPSY